MKTIPIKHSGKGFKWGSKGHTYPTRAGAAKQAAAAHANGYKGDTNEKKTPKKKKPVGKKSK